MPIADLIAAATSVLGREGRTLASYGLESGPLGYRRLREFLVGKLKADAGISCTVDEILITSGSLQGIELVNGILLSRGDTVLIEQVTYFGSLNRLVRLGVNPIGIPLDHEGLRMDVLSATLDDLKAQWDGSRNISTPFRRSRIRPAPSWASRAGRSCCGSRKRTTCRSSRTTAMRT